MCPWIVDIYHFNWGFMSEKDTIIVDSTMDSCVLSHNTRIVDVHCMAPENGLEK